jgi:vacuolar protein-sorting-associated protein 4
MQNNFTPQAVEIVKQAIDHDNLGEYEKALGLYRRALEFFMTGLKYEQNPAARKMILERVDGYMKRAEEIKNVLETQGGPPPSKGGGGAKTLDKNDPKHKDGKDDDENAKMRGALSSSIISEKPNVKWDDVAGLEMAKEALKEGESRERAENREQRTESREQRAENREQRVEIRNRERTEDRE